MVYGAYKALFRGIVSLKRDKAFAIASNPKYDGYQLGLS